MYTKRKDWGERERRERRGDWRRTNTCLYDTRFDV